LISQPRCPLFRSSAVQSIRSPNCTQQRSPVSHRVTVKYRNHTQIPKKSPTRSGEDPENCLLLAINFSTAESCCLSAQADEKRPFNRRLDRRRIAGGWLPGRVPARRPRPAICRGSHDCGGRRHDSAGDAVLMVAHAALCQNGPEHSAARTTHLHLVHAETVGRGLDCHRPAAMVCYVQFQAHEKQIPAQDKPKSIMRDDPGFIFIRLLAGLGPCLGRQDSERTEDRASLGASGIARGA
jgi:hypothetical protein